MLCSKTSNSAVSTESSWSTVFGSSPSLISTFSGFRFRDSGFGIRDSGFGFRDSGFGFRVSGFEFRVSHSTGYGVRHLDDVDKAGAHRIRKGLDGHFLGDLHLIQGVGFEVSKRRTTRLYFKGNYGP